MTKSRSAKPGQAKSRPDKLTRIGAKSDVELGDPQLQKAVGGKPYIGETEKNL